MDRSNGIPGRPTVRSGLLLLAVICSLHAGRTQGTLPDTRLIPVRSVELLDQYKGLGSEFHYSVYKDSRGLVWISSISGLYQFDGTRVRIRHPDQGNPGAHFLDHIHSEFVEDVNGDVWFGTWRGVIRYERLKDRFAPWYPAWADPTNRFSVCLLDPDGWLWFLHGRGLFRRCLDDGTVVKVADVPPNLTSIEILKDKNGYPTDAFIFQRATVKPGAWHLSLRDGQAEAASQILTEVQGEPCGVQAIRKTPDGRIWLATSAGLLEWDGHGGPAGPEPEEIHFPGQAVSSLTTYQDSLMLVGFMSGTYRVMDPRTGQVVQQFRIQYRGEELEQDPGALQTDTRGGIWIFLRKKGIAYFHPDLIAFDYFPLRSALRPSAPPLNVSGLRRVNQRTLLATGLTGTWLIRVGAGVVDDVEPCRLCPQNVKSVYRDSRHLIWMNDGPDLYVMDSLERVFRIERPPAMLFGWGFAELTDGRMVNLRHGDLYIGTLSDSGHWKFRPLTEIRSGTDHTNPMVLPDGQLWFTRSPFDNLGAVSVVSYDPERSFRLSSQRPGYWGIRSWVDLDREMAGNHLLLATTQGVMEKEGDRIHRLALYPDSLRTIWAIFRLKDGKIWIGGDDRMKFLDLEDGRVETIAEDRGPGMEGVTWFGAFQDGDGRIWAGHHEGMSVLRDKADLDIRLPARIRFSSILVNDREESLEPFNRDRIRNPDEVRALELPYRMNTLTVFTSVMAYDFSYTRILEYRLAGLEKAWVRGEPRSPIRYAGLAPGRYTLEIRLAGEPEALRRLPIRIITPFFMTGWFYVLLFGLAVAGLVYAWSARQRRAFQIARLHLEKEIALQQERLRIASNLHDDLGSELSALHLRLQILLGKVRESGTREDLDQIVQLSRGLVASVREAIWTTNAEKDYLDDLLGQLADMSRDFLSDAGLEVNVDLPDLRVPVPLSGHLRREIYLAVKEAVHNIVKHSGATSVRMNFSRTDKSRFVLEISDDGRGLDPDQVHDGMGLQSMASRLRFLDGQFEILGMSGGTKVTFDVPLS